MLKRIKNKIEIKLANHDKFSSLSITISIIYANFYV